MQEIVNNSCRNLFATVILYALFTKGGFVLPYPIYEILFFVLISYLLYRSLSIRINSEFFIFLFILASFWIFSSLFFLQLFLSHEFTDSLMLYQPLVDIIFVVTYIVIMVVKFTIKMYTSIHMLLLFLLISKWVMFFI